MTVKVVQVRKHTLSRDNDNVIFYFPEILGRSGQWKNRLTLRYFWSLLSKYTMRWNIFTIHKYKSWWLMSATACSITTHVLTSTIICLVTCFNSLTIAFCRGYSWLRYRQVTTAIERLQWRTASLQGDDLLCSVFVWPACSFQADFPVISQIKETLQNGTASDSWGCWGEQCVFFPCYHECPTVGMCMRRLNAPRDTHMRVRVCTTTALNLLFWRSILFF